MSSLAFRLLDAHVIEGRADEPALILPGATRTFAHLLHDSASFAAGLRAMGADDDARIGVLTTDPGARVVSLLACVRLGLVPAGEDASLTVDSVPAVVRAGALVESWDVVLRAGRGDPATARATDAAGYAEQMVTEHAEVLSPLLAGRPVVFSA